ncbi:DNA (cytosine-5-)-methyltransferase [Fusobacterium sp. SB021]|uniref:DNA cytosine methyltransferase n=1 Tax=Fusobacterium sp. SB021 TaxID=2744227 RepID=UPI003CF3395F
MREKLKFIDLFAGIGGFRLGFESNDCECVFSSEIDEHACKVYELNFGNNPYCDITKVDTNEIPDFDILCAGFPCQAFSICGKQRGFYDETRGTLFFDICRVLKEKNPTAFVLENVSNLEKHDSGRTLTVMLSALTELGYTVNYNVLNAKNFGVPQNRERILIIGNKKGIAFDFSKLKITPIESMKPFLDKSGDFEILSPESYTLLDKSLIKKQKKSGLIFCGYRNKKIRTTGVRPGTEHLSRVHKQPNRIYDSIGIHPTLASQESSGRYFIKDDSIVRKLTLNECFKFMGFPEEYRKIGSTANLYARIGNSICVNMVKAIASEMINQIFKGEKSMNNVNEFLEAKYLEAEKVSDIASIKLLNKEIEWIKNIVNKEETFKGVFTVLLTSIVYKCLYPEQDVRKHQANMAGGYSGRSFDTKYITPFMKQKRFLGAMKESGWLTRSLEQNLPYDLNYPGKIQNKDVKESFLNLLDSIEKDASKSEKYLLAIMSYSIKCKKEKTVILVNPIEKETSITISEIIDYLYNHFYFSYKSRGASILPVIALYSIYECIIKELKRFENKKLDILASHNSSDKSSGETGDIVVRNEDDSIYEVVEVKFDIPINRIMIMDAYEKIKDKPVQRYYILSTVSPKDEEKVYIDEIISDIRKEHGCQFIVNGVLPTVKYYLRLLENTDVFLKNYMKTLSNNREINYEHRIAWNKIFENN